MHMMFHPEVQKNAQDEVDRVLGKSRLPSVKDEAAFTYLNAVLKEVLRSTPVARLGALHVSFYESSRGPNLPDL